MKYIDFPQTFFDIEDATLVNMFQNSLHSLVNIFYAPYCPTTFSKLITNPWTPVTCTYIKGRSISEQLKRILSYLVDMKRRNFPISEQLIYETRKLSEYMSSSIHISYVARLISRLYRCLDEDILQCLEKKTFGLVRVSNYEIFQEEPYMERDSKFFRPLLLFSKFSTQKVQSYVKGLFLHGSLSTMDYVKGWSDVDTLCILSGETILDSRNMLRLWKFFSSLMRFFYAIDPFQHHGVMIITEIDMDYYPQTYFPLVIFQYSKIICPKEVESLSFCERPSKMEAYNEIERICKAILRKGEKGAVFPNIYNFKLFLHSILLIPTLYLQTKGIFCYKRHSFQHARKYFGRDDWSVIEISSYIRQKWPDLRISPNIIGRLYAQLGPNPYLYRYIHLLEDHVKMLDYQLSIPRIIRKAKVLATSILKKISKKPLK